MIVKVTKSGATWHVRINGAVVNLAAWADGKYVGQAQAIGKSQAILVAQRIANEG